MAAVSPGPRDRIVYTTVQHLRRQGVAATGLRGVVADAQAPWGSLRHYFPGGKDQLVVEAMSWAGTFAAGRVQHYLREAADPTPSGLFDDLVLGWARELEGRDYERGCPVAAAIVDSSDANESVRCAAADALETWRAPLELGLVSMGVDDGRARDLAVLMLCSLEGAILMARARRSVEPLQVVLRTLTPVLEAEPRS
jgi:AcrR family transcriptional regulator